MTSKVHRRQIATRAGPLSAFLLAGLVVFTGCSDDAVSPAGSGYDPVYSDDGGFIITQGMLDKPYNRMTFPATHNSHTAGNFWSGVCAGGTKNQGLSISSQLANGIRYIELDINCYYNLCHGGIHSPFALFDQFTAIREFVEAHPKQIFTVRISDVNRDPCTLSLHDICVGVNDRLRSSGLAAYVYNFDGSLPNDDPAVCFVPSQWPTIGEMIDNGKNVMFFHNRDYGEFGIFDEGLCRGLSYGDPDLHWFYAAKHMEQLSEHMVRWSPPRERQQEGANRLFFVECIADECDAGDLDSAAKNNDGRKLYQLARRYEGGFLDPQHRAVNFISVDYFMSSHAHELPIDVVDACNRLNYERFGIDWERSTVFWELYPHEFDPGRVEYISQIAALHAELNEVVDDLENRRNLDGHEDRGDIVSTTYYTIRSHRTSLQYDWKCIPEWAVDGDLFTRWCGSSSRPNHTWGIDLGSRKRIDEIAIAWEFSHKSPAYRVYVSNDDERFAELISNDELLSDNGWTEVVAQPTERSGISPPELWDTRVIEYPGPVRYVRIKVTDADESYWPSFSEVRLYGPSSQPFHDNAEGRCRTIGSSVETRYLNSF